MINENEVVFLSHLILFYFILFFILFFIFYFFFTFLSLLFSVFGIQEDTRNGDS